MFVGAEPVWCGYQSAVSQGWVGVLASDHNVYVAGHGNLVTCHALIQYLDKAGLFFKGSEQFPHPLDINKVRLSEHVRSTINIDVAPDCVFAFETHITEQDCISQQTIVKGLLLPHQFENLGANRHQAFAAKLDVKITRRAFEFILRNLIFQSDNLVMHRICRDRKSTRLNSSHEW